MTSLPTIVRCDGGWSLSWDRGTLHMEVELYDDGQVHWFTRDRATGEIACSHEREAPFPPEMVERLAALDWCKP